MKRLGECWGWGGVDLGLRCWQGGIEGDWLQIGVDIFTYIYIRSVDNKPALLWSELVGVRGAVSQVSPCW